MRDEFDGGQGAGGADDGAGTPWSVPASDREVAVLRALEQGLRHHRDGELRLAADWYYSVLDIHPDQPDALHLLGLISYQSGDGPTGIRLIDRAVGSDPANAVFHVSRGDVLQSLGRAEEAISAYHKGIAHDPEIPEAYNNCGHVLNALGRFAEAESHLQQALALRPDYATAYNNLGNVLRAQGQVERAIDCILRALEHAPDDAVFHSNLGVALREAGRLEEAVASHERALALKPDLAEAHFNLGNARGDTGDVLGAAASFRNAMELRPDFVDAAFNLGNVLRQCGAHADAVETYRNAISRRPDFSEAHNNLGNVLRDLGLAGDALGHFRIALDLDPSLDNARHMINALTGVTTDRAPSGYVRDLFDHYAERFDHHQVQELDYRVPQALAEAVTRSGGPIFDQALDLGCGTGLVVQAMRERVKAFDGIDLSPKMLAVASNKGLYRTLVEGDVAATLRDGGALADRYDLVVAGDVFIYLGELQSVMEGVRRYLTDGGLFAFSVETLDVGSFALTASGRYVHSDAYVRDTATKSGYEIDQIDPLVIRKERGRAVPGLVFVLRRRQ